MKILPGTFSRFPLALGAGLLLAASFPQFSIAGFAWIAPGLLLVAALGRSGAESFRLGYVAGLAHYLASLYWLLLIPYTWHGLPLGPAFGWLALSAYLALFPAAWVGLALKLAGGRKQISNLQPSTAAQRNAPGASSTPSPRPSGERTGVRGTELETEGLLSPPLSSFGEGEGVAAALSEIAAWSWGRRMVWALTCAAGWVALEMIVVRFLGGFPWNLLGTSQYRISPLIQIASLTGVHGVAFLVVWTSVSLLGAVAVIVHRPQMRSVWLGEIILPLLAVAAAFAFGFHQISKPAPTTRTLRVTLVQPSIPQTLIWDSANDAERFRGLLRLSEQALTNETDLLVWPEAAIPKMLRYDEEILNGVTQLARAHRVWMIVGSDDAEPARASREPGATAYFNSAFLINPQGEIAERYNKRNLVIFGEYIPLVRWLPFLKWFTPIDGGFTPGTEATRFDLGELKIKIAPLICYEDTFPQLGRTAAGGDTDLLVNLTNDGWFGEGAAQWQQAAGAAFRAVENGLPLVRCANTGLSCWMDGSGTIREMLTDKTGGIYGAGFRTVTVPLTGNREPTFYQRHGDWFGWGCTVWTALALGLALLARRAANGKRKPEQKPT